MLVRSLWPSLPALLGLLLIAGCSAICEDDDCPLGAPVTGAPAESTRGMAQIGDVWISAPRPCADPSPEIDAWIDVVGTGSRAFAGAGDAGEDALQSLDWSIALHRELADVRGLPVHSVGYGISCGPAFASVYLTTNDWAAVDAIVGAVAERMRDDDVNGRVEVRIGREVVTCAEAAYCTNSF